MQFIGKSLLCCAVLIALVAFAMDVSEPVAFGGGAAVVKVGLVAKQQSLGLLSVVLAVVGGALLVAGQVRALGQAAK